MNRAVILAALVLWLGATLVLAEVRALRRPRLTARLRPHLGRGLSADGRSGVLSVASMRDVLGPIVFSVGTTLSRALGVDDDLSLRLRRAGSPLDPTAFRLRQAARSGAGAAAGLALGVLAGLGTLLCLGAAVAGAVLTFLVIEQRVVGASRRRQDRLRAELPVVAEQIGMLLGAGFSLGSALGRVGRRGNGVCSEDLHVVGNRVRQGLSELEALREWASIAEVPELGRLVTVLALNGETGDAGRLISDEARTMRADAQRRTVELLERRSQMVWVPVTVATLIPGVLLMAIPFLAAMRNWSAI